MFQKKNRLTHLFTISLIVLLAACGSDDDAEPENQDQNQENDETPVQVDPPGEEVSSELTRDTSPEVAAEAFEEFSADNRDFAFSLLGELRDGEEEENAFISPHSISVALAMTYAGAEDNTRDEMQEVLRFYNEGDDLHAAFNELDLALDSRSEVELDDDEALDLDVVNQTWGHFDFDFVDDYLDLLATHYGASQLLVDFVNDFEEVREGINEWVEAQTEERIQDLLPPNSLSEATRFVLVNAIYFYGTWDEPFAEEQTWDGEFTRLDGSTVEVPLMRDDRSFDAFYDPEEDTVALSLPYSGEEISMIAWMPSDENADFVEWEEDFNREDFDALIDGMTNQRIMMSLPRFEDEADFELKEVFEKMGIVDAFDECDADFEGITGHPPCIDFKSLYIDDIYHQTFISVDEEGTEAAGATGVVMDTPTSAPPAIHFNRPFYYALYDHPTDTILFMGRMVDPS